MESEQFIRQLGIIDPEKLTQSIGVVGAGSIGGWTVLALLKMGCFNITVYDFDKVEEHNTGSQIFTSDDKERSKLEALKFKLGAMTDGVDIQTVEGKITEENVSDLLNHDMVISAVDNIETRKLIFDVLKASEWKGTFIDGRMAANTIEIYTTPMSDADRVTHYELTLFDPENASPVACSMRSVVYNVFIVAGIITDLVAKIANEQETPKELTIDLFNFSMMGGFL